MTLIHRKLSLPALLLFLTLNTQAQQAPRPDDFSRWETAISAFEKATRPPRQLKEVFSSSARRPYFSGRPSPPTFRAIQSSIADLVVHRLSTRPTLPTASSFLTGHGRSFSARVEMTSMPENRPPRSSLTSRILSHGFTPNCRQPRWSSSGSVQPLPVGSRLRPTANSTGWSVNLPSGQGM